MNATNEARRLRRRINQHSNDFMDLIRKGMDVTGSTQDETARKGQHLFLTVVRDTVTLMRLEESEDV